ncbi:hypothetical protein EMIT0P12_10889 [Pseudomonas sp. IT-P12]
MFEHCNGVAHCRGGEAKLDSGSTKTPMMSQGDYGVEILQSGFSHCAISCISSSHTSPIVCASA